MQFTKTLETKRLGMNRDLGFSQRRYEDDGLTECDGMQSGRLSPVFGQAEDSETV
jgi:hypothetical protein